MNRYHLRRGGNIEISDSRPIGELVSQLSGGAAHSKELVYLETHLNDLKVQLFADNTPSTLTLAIRQLALVSESSAIYLYLQNPHISSIFKSVSGLIKTFYLKLDSAYDRKARGPCAVNVQWASSYQT